MEHITWVVICVGAHICPVIFRAVSTCLLCSLFDKKSSWKQRWQLGYSFQGITNSGLRIFQHFRAMSWFAFQTRLGDHYWFTRTALSSDSDLWLLMTLMWITEWSCWTSVQVQSCLRQSLVGFLGLFGCSQKYYLTRIPASSETLKLVQY